MSPDIIINSHKLLDGDIVDENNIIHKKSIWREKSIAGVLILDKMYGKEKKKWLFKCIPYNKVLPVFLVPYEEKINFTKTRINKYVLIKFKHWNDKHPLGELLQTFGNVDMLSCLYDYLLFALDIHISNQCFTKQFMNCLKNQSKHTILESMKQKYNIEDRTKYEIYTIDGETTRDFDDAIGLIQEKGVCILSIYISNPVLWMDYLQLWNHYGGRTSSIYLPDRVVNMLPNKMSNQMVGLIEGESSIAFVMDITISHNKIENIQYNNVLVKIRKNFIYEEPDLLSNPMYNSIVTMLNKLDMKVADSYKCIEKLMIFFNSRIGDTLSKYGKGIYRYCRVTNATTTSVPDALSEYAKWADTQSAYALFNKDLIHELLGVSFYTQMSSPIRRIVDIVNMIEMHENEKLCQLHEDTIIYKNYWINQIDVINDNRRSIKRLESETKLLNYYLTEVDGNSRVYDGYIVNILNEHKYMVFIPELQSSAVLKVIKNIDLYTKIKCSLCLLRDEINIIQKIRIMLIS